MNNKRKMSEIHEIATKHFKLAESKSDISESSSSQSRDESSSEAILSEASTSSNLGPTEFPASLGVPKTQNGSLPEAAMCREISTVSLEDCVEIEDYLHKLTDLVISVPEMFHVVIIGGRKVGKKTLRNYMPLLKKHGVQMSVTVQAEWKKSNIKKIRAIEHKIEFNSTEDVLLIQLTTLFPDRSLPARVVREKAHMYIYLFDFHQRTSLVDLQYLTMSHIAIRPSIPSILIGNNMDLPREPLVKQEDIDNLYRKLKCSHYGEISTTTGKGMMEEVWLQILRVRKDWMHKILTVLYNKCRVEYENHKQQKQEDEAELKKEMEGGDEMDASSNDSSSDQLEFK